MFLAVIFLSAQFYNVAPAPIVPAQASCVKGDPQPGNFLYLIKKIEHQFMKSSPANNISSVVLSHMDSSSYINWQMSLKSLLILQPL